MSENDLMDAMKKALRKAAIPDVEQAFEKTSRSELLRMELVRLFREGVVEGRREMAEDLLVCELSSLAIAQIEAAAFRIEKLYSDFRYVSDRTCTT